MVIRFGTWNVCTVLQAGNMNMIAEEVERYKMDVVTLQKIRIFFTTENEDIQPSYKEVIHVIKCLKTHKAPGTDQIIAELKKHRRNIMEKNQPSY